MPLNTKDEYQVGSGTGKKYSIYTRMILYLPCYPPLLGEWHHSEHRVQPSWHIQWQCHLALSKHWQTFFYGKEPLRSVATKKENRNPKNRNLKTPNQDKDPKNLGRPRDPTIRRVEVAK